MPDSQTIEHIHKQESEETYRKEVTLIGLNHTVYLKSDERNETLRSMTDLAIDTMHKIKEMGEK